LSNYDFNNLNDKEFELLVNDLISQSEGARVDRFKPGKDSGVDGRFFTIQGEEVIIQSKHWIKSGIPALINQLIKKELPKVKSLNPKRYILATSLELSGANKKKIKAAFEPFIVSELDILGKENLNDLLSNHLTIEKKHYKLWLSSSAVLSIILNNALTGRSEAKRSEIMESAGRYVETKNHLRAFKKLEETRSVIITGEAGIGKTSLADQLAHFYIAEGFELCVIEEEISEAESAFRINEKQVFYFDDFLGRNFLTALQGHQDSHILNFIERVSKDPTKRFILTSRTTILNQGKSLSDLFGIKKVDKNEYEIRIRSLSDLDKAKILYNHIWFGNLDEDHISELYRDKRYLKIVRHKNFNPRLISFITDQDRFSNSPVDSYWDHTLDTLRNPQNVWANVFDNQIDDLMRLAVCLVVFNGNQIDEEDFRSSFCTQALTNGLINKSNSNNRFNKTLRNSVGAVLNRTVNDDDLSAYIDLFNPSVADFVLARYLSDHESMKEFFLHLNTLQSVENLQDLHKSSSLSDDAYLTILDYLGSKKLSKTNFKDNTAYSLKLMRLLIEQYKQASREIVKSISNLAEIINSVPIQPNSIEDVSIILSCLIKSKPSLKYTEVGAAFITQCIEIGPDHEDFECLHGLSQNLDYDFVYERGTWEELRSGVEVFWKNNIDEIVTKEEVLEDYMDHAESGDAFNKLWEYLSDKLFSFDFSDDEITSIAEHVSIEAHIDSNQEAAAQEDHEYESRKEWAEHSPQDESAQINDLFERG